MKNFKAFTLVELVIATAIFTFLLTMSLVGFINIINIYRLANVNREMQVDLQKALDIMIDDIESSRDIVLIDKNGGNIDFPGATNGTGVMPTSAVSNPEEDINIETQTLCIKGKKLTDDIVYVIVNEENSNDLLDGIIDEASIVASLEDSNTKQGTAVLVRYSNVRGCDVSNILDKENDIQVITSPEFRLYSIAYAVNQNDGTIVSSDGLVESESRNTKNIKSVLIDIELRSRRILSTGAKRDFFNSRINYSVISNSLGK